ncbi:MAG TPA: ABC transporter ATP-binding protein, partial [Acidimicrobiales bacterium]
VVAGQPMDARATDAKAAIGLVPQEVALYEDMSAEENLRFFGRLQGLAGRELSARVGEVLELVGLADRARDRLGAYSGGMKRRANIAAGLLHRPRLLVLDEPTVGVDPQSRNAILGSIEALGEEGLSVLYTTHYMEEAERLCDRIGIIDEGRLVAEGTRRELVARLGEGDRVVVTGTGDLAAFAAACEELPGVLGVEVRRSADADVDAGGADGDGQGDAAEAPDTDDRAADDRAAGDHAVADRADRPGRPDRADRPGQVVVRVADGSAALAGVVAAGERTSLAITGVQMEEPDLEDVFLGLTGKALRD